MYAYAESPDASSNLEYVLRHGVHSKADWIFVLNGVTKAQVPERDNVRVIKRPNKCYDMGAFGEVMTNEPDLRKKSAQVVKF